MKEGEKMKKLLCVSMALFMCFGLAACGSSDDKGKEEEKPAEKEEKKDTYQLGEEIKMEHSVLKISSINISDGEDFYKKDGVKYVSVKVNIENTCDDTISYNPLQFTLQNSQGQIEDSSLYQGNDALHSGKLAPGGKVEGTITFEELEAEADGSKLTLLIQANVFDSDNVVKVNLVK